MQDREYNYIIRHTPHPKKQDLNGKYFDISIYSIDFNLVFKSILNFETFLQYHKEIKQRRVTSIYISALYIYMVWQAHKLRKLEIESLRGLAI